ncbi:hypothetical protein GHT06_012004 [Daphnia sinensis]|uniref:Cadherin-related family member 1 n=1 Tax=Daphnia sinensis TaxID=1820382 RepID=A0AAD5LNF2_9CRUS|nr:hypothetical protein GHT06_012004 [Daphnia sinensis]
MPRTPWPYCLACEFLVVIIAASGNVRANLPTFDEDSRMRILLLPFSTLPGSTIYRVRASDPDFDHPLEFSSSSLKHPNLLSLEILPCGKQHSVCEANVILEESVELGKIYELSLSVRDTSGGVTTVFCTIQVTNASTSLSDSFQHLNQYLTIPENSAKDSVVDYFIALKNPNNIRGIRVELRKTKQSRNFRLSDKLAGSNRTNCSIILEQPLDFEIQTVHVLRILAVNAYVDNRMDTRNVVEVLIYVFVMDVQDTPPFFVKVPPITAVSDKLEIGQVVLRVKAEDGDKGSPRDINYVIMVDNNPFAPFFFMEPQTGELKVRKKLVPLNQMVRSKAPFLLTVMAEEMGSLINESNTTTTIDIALMIEDETNDPPEFNQDRFVAHLMENSPVGTALYFGDGQNPLVTDNDQGHNGIFSLSLLGDNSTFEISPSVAENAATFTIRVKNPALLDFERTQQLRFKVVAEEVQHGSNKVSTVDVIVYITDDNDHIPVFEKDTYISEIAEHSSPGTVVIQVRATDSDSGKFGTVRYTQLHGIFSKALVLDPISGLITVGSGVLLDRETSPEITVTVEARDMEGTGRSATVPVIIRLLDINDNAPQFIGLPYETNLTPDLSRLTSKVVVQAIDNDTSPTNGAVRYEIVRGNFESKFKISEMSGEVTLMAPLTSTNLPSLIQLHVRAYDLGVPHLHAETVVQIFTQEVVARSIHFLVPKRMDSLPEREEDVRKMEMLLTLLTGAPTTINNVQPYLDEIIAMSKRIDSQDPNNHKSRLVATVRFPPHAAIVDVQRIRDALISNEFDLNGGVSIEREYRYKNNVLLWLLIAFLLFFLATMIFLAICCCCPGCYCYNDRKKIGRFGGGVRPVMVVDGRSGQTSDLTTPGRKEAWSGGKRLNQIRRTTRDRMATLPEPDSHRRAFRIQNANGGMQHIYSEEAAGYDQSRTRQYAEEHSDMEFLEIHPEDSASHHGVGENAFYYQRMGNADVMKLDTALQRNRRLSTDSQCKTVRRSNSEPRLNESEIDQIDVNNSSKSMINFPHRTCMEEHMALNWRVATEQQHRNSLNKYVQSPILEETDSALEREMQTGSSFYLRPKGLFDFHHNGGRNVGGQRQFLPPDVERGARQAWHQMDTVNPTINEANMSVKRPDSFSKEIKELEREMPYFNNRSSFLRHKLNLNKKNNKKQPRTKSSSRNPIMADGDETESASSNDRSQRNSGRNTVVNAASASLAKSNKLLTEDDRDSGIVLNPQQQLGNGNNRSRFLEKKSIFTIAYDEVATTKIPSATDNLPT